MITSHVSEPTSVDSSFTHRFKRHPCWLNEHSVDVAFLISVHQKWKIYGSVETHGGRDSTKGVFSPQTFTMTDANVCGGGCKRLRERLQCFASEKGKTGTEIASPILVKRVLATVPARTCNLPCTYLREKSCRRGICELDFCVAPPS